MNKHEGIIVATDETDHMAFLCPKCDKAMCVLSVHTTPRGMFLDGNTVTDIQVKCPGCGHNHWRKFDWGGKTAAFCKHRTDAATKGGRS